ncbi:MAG TPA: type II toxin-antitoxin system HicB family antitoxin [Firmicutes bacterium]|nr:type II toxin-antitoxin system HicB family antitoxin [Bacillota bacterium]HHY97457.1 type II toxin-antitoxin system HicB family antitoxin [Bacillota bacterium]
MVDDARSRFPVILVDGEDGYIIAECPVLPGCMSQGKTREEALENIKEAIILSLETRKAHNMPLRTEMIMRGAPGNRVVTWLRYLSTLHLASIASGKGLASELLFQCL